MKTNKNNCYKIALKEAFTLHVHVCITYENNILLKGGIII